MRRLRTVAPLTLVAVVTSSAVGAVVTSTPFRGITDYHVTETSPVALDYHVVRVDVADPDVRFQVTESNGAEPGDTNRETTRAFVTRVGAQVGINANFFDNSDPFSTTTTLLGLTASNGSVVTPWAPGFDQGINFSSDNVATVIERDASDANNLASLPDVSPYNVVSGIVRLVRNGVKQTRTEPELHPRTAIGVASDGDVLLLTVDGRNAGHSVGMTFQQLADVMFAYGAVDAFNLDGGGSTTLVFADPTPRVVNVPVGVGNVPGTERTNGNNLAIFAAPVPEPGTGSTMFVVLFGLVARVRRAS